MYTFAMTYVRMLPLMLVLLSVASPVHAQGIVVTNLELPAQCLTVTHDLSRGMRAPEVVALQKFLLAQGYLEGNPAHTTGFFGPITERSVLAFQASRQIPQTGRADLVTRAAVMIASCGKTAFDMPKYIPMFRGIHGPVVVSRGETESWTAIVNNEYSSKYRVLVSWGDGSLSEALPKQSIGSDAFTFEHSFAQPGEYDIVFTVTNQAGRSNTSQVTVRVD